MQQIRINYIYNKENARHSLELDVLEIFFVKQTLNTVLSQVSTSFPKQRKYRTPSHCHYAHNF